MYNLIQMPNWFMSLVLLLLALSFIKVKVKNSLATSFNMKTTN